MTIRSWKALPLVALLLTMALAVTPAFSAADPVINEIRIDQPGTDNDEFFELQGAPGSSLDGLTYLVIGDGSGGSGVIEAVVSLNGQTIPASGYFLAAESTFTLGTPNLVANLNFENDDNVTHLLVRGFSGANNQDLDTNDDGVLDATPWAAIVDSVSLAQSLTGGDKMYSSTIVGPSGSFVPGVVYRCGADWRIGSFSDLTNDTPGAANGCPILLSEIRIDQPGTDNDEFFELQGAPGSSLDGLTYLVIGDGSGGSGVIEAVVSLNGQTIPASGYFLAAESTFTLGTPNLVANLNFENDDNVTHLLVRGFSGANNQDLDTNDDGVLDATPWAAIVDSVSLAQSLTGGDKMYSSTIVGPSGSFVPGVVYRCGADWRIGSFSDLTKDTPGVANGCAPPPPPVEVCGDPFTPTYTIQGSGMDSALDGSVVSTEGVVTADFQLGSELGGFFIQDPAGDANPLTSDGIFVYASTAVADVAVGDQVRVKGTVDEYFGLTEITGVTQLLTCGTGAITPTVVDLPVTAVSDLEAYEGMLITIPETMTATEHYNLGRYGEVHVSADGRLYIPTNTPGVTAEGNAARRLLIDDASNIQNPAVVPYLAADNTLRLGDTVTGLTGVLSYGFDYYRLQPTAPVNFVRANPRPAAPDAVGGTIKIASLNTLNYWTTLGGRGANTAEEFQRQQAKLVAAILGLDADIIGLQELEANGDVAIADLVAALNGALGSNVWAYVPEPYYPGGLQSANPIKVGIIYRADRVSTVGDPLASLDPIYAEDRPPVAQTFNARGEIFTVVSNHFKSKGCDGAVGLDLDQGDGQSCYNYRRTLQAQALLTFIEELKISSGDPDVIVVGDLNSYALEDPIDVLNGALFNPIAAFMNPFDAYSYAFNGEVGQLDHAFTTLDMAARVTGADIWHINADEPRILDYNTEFNPPGLYSPDAYRSSDHDPVLIGVCDAVGPTFDLLTATPDTLTPPNHKYVDVTVEVLVSDNFDPNVVVSLVSVTSNEPDEGLGDGDTPNDIVIVDDFTFQLRAERSGTGTGRVYTITYQAVDSCGNTTLASVTVTVPFSQGNGRGNGK